MPGWKHDCSVYTTCACVARVRRTQCSMQQQLASAITRPCSPATAAYITAFPPPTHKTSRCARPQYAEQCGYIVLRDGCRGA